MTETNNSDTMHHGDKDVMAPSEARVILGPLVKYALMGLVLAVVVLTTVVMLDHRITDINREVAALEAELAAANQYVAKGEPSKAPQSQTNEDESATTRVTAASPASDATTQSAASEAQMHSSRDAIARPDESDKAGTSTPVAADTTVAQSPDEKRVASTALTTNVESVIGASTMAKTPDTHQSAEQSNPVVMIDHNERWLPYDQTFEAIIAERNAYMKHQDHVYLEDYKASQEKQLRLMRDRLARQQQRIKDMEVLYQQRYEFRAEDLKELQEIRESFMPDRI